MNKKKIVSERAHLMCPNMFFGIMIKLNEGYEEDKFYECLSLIKKAHPVINSYIEISDVDESAYFTERKDFEINYNVEQKRDWKEIFKQISYNGWDVRKESMLKVYVFPQENQFQILLAAHHILCDGRGLLQIAKELAACYVNGEKPEFADGALIKDIEDLPVGSDLSFISRYVVNSANKNWDKEKSKVKYDEYLKFEKEFAKKNEIGRRIIDYSNDKTDEMIKVCRENNISVNDYLIAYMMKEENVNKVIIAEDIRSKIKSYCPKSIGNYATAYSVVVKKNDGNLVTMAKKVKSKVNKIKNSPAKQMMVLSCYFTMNPELIDAVAISSLGDFNSKAGKFVGEMMFGYKERNGYSITNLGKIESDSIAEGFFIPPASPANTKTWGVLTVNGRMRIVEVGNTLL